MARLSIWTTGCLNQAQVARAESKVMLANTTFMGLAQPVLSKVVVAEGVPSQEKPKDTFYEYSTTLQPSPPPSCGSSCRSSRARRARMIVRLNITKIGLISFDQTHASDRRGTYLRRTAAPDNLPLSEHRSSALLKYARFEQYADDVPQIVWLRL